MSQSILKAAVGVAALAAIAFGASAIAGASGSSNRSGAALGGPAGAARGAPGAARGAPGAAGGFPGPPGGAPPGGANGARPQGRPPFLGRPVTGATAAKVAAAALARYPGTIEHIEAIPGLGYVAHVFRSGGGGEVHVLVNQQFQVTGLAPFPGGGHPPSGSAS